MKLLFLQPNLARGVSRLLRFCIVGTIVSTLMGCGQPPQEAQKLVPTKIALGVQLTQIAKQTQQTANSTLQAGQATLMAQSAKTTDLANQAMLSAQATQAANQVALSAQETQNAGQAMFIAQATQTAYQATLLAGQVQPTTIDLSATQIALAVQATSLALQQSQLTLQVQTQSLATLPPPIPASQSQNQLNPQAQTQDFETWMKSANILLYEDMVARPNIVRYFKKTLDMMGLNYKDDGSARGWLKSDLFSGGPNGKGWDLIIMAIEDRIGISGEFFTYVNQAINQDTPVIMEIWYLDRISGGEVSMILSKCGVEARNYIGKNQDPVDLIVWPLSGALDHPLLRVPNAGLTFTDVWEFWPYTDLGDLLSLTGRGDAQLLLGTIATERNNHGTLAVCLDDMLILQTFSSHSFTYDVMSLLIENYIYNALFTRYNNP